MVAKGRETEQKTAAVTSNVISSSDGSCDGVTGWIIEFPPLTPLTPLTALTPLTPLTPLTLPRHVPQKAHYNFLVTRVSLVHCTGPHTDNVCRVELPQLKIIS